MSFKQYRRLLLILVFPLLLVGFLFALFVAPYGDGPYITCEPLSADYENCRNIGWEGSLNESVISSYPSWFDVQLTDEEMNGPLFSYIQGSQRGFDDASILSASPYSGHGPDVASFMGGFAGQPARIILGIAEGQKSIIEDEGLLLFCNNLSFEKADHEYQAGCYGEDWSGPVRFTLGEEGGQRLDLLRRFASEEIDKATTDYRIYQFVMYPLFIYLFLLASALVWLSMRAYRFVRAG